MRVIIFITFLLSVCSAQGQFRSLIKAVDGVEFSVGPSYVTLHNKSLNRHNRETKITPQIAVGAIYQLTKKTGLLLNISYNRTGLKQQSQVYYYDPTIDFTNCKCTLSTSPGTLKTNSNLHYATISPRLRKQIFKNLFIDAGIFIGYLVKAQIRQDRLWDGTHEIADIKFDYNNLNFGQETSITFLMKVSNRNSIYFRISNSFGIVNIVSKSTQGSSTRTNGLSLSIGMKLNLNETI